MFKNDELLLGGKVVSEKVLGLNPNWVLRAHPVRSLRVLLMSVGLPSGSPIFTHHKDMEASVLLSVSLIKALAKRPGVSPRASCV